MTQLKLGGILAAIVTPFTEDGSLDEGRLRTYLEWLADQAVHGAVVHADAGEGHTLTPAEREAVTRIAFRGTGGTHAGRGRADCAADDRGAEARSTGSGRRSQRLDGLSADAVPGSADAAGCLPTITKYHQALADEVGLPLSPSSFSPPSAV